MVEKYLDEAAAKTLDIADKKTLFDLSVRKIEVKQGNLSVDFKIKIYSTMVALTGIEPVISPWEGDVLAAWPWRHWLRD